MGSTRLPGKVLESIEGEPMLSWTVRSVRAIPGIAGVVVATTTEPADDAVVAAAERIGVDVHRGSATDVLSRCHDAVAPFRADVVIRQTADNPFPDPTVAAAQVERLVDGGFDYVGIDGWPLGIAAETCRMAALALAAREATDAADREHVMPFLYRQPDRFRVGRLERSGASRRRPAGTRSTPPMTSPSLASSPDGSGTGRRSPSASSRRSRAASLTCSSSTRRSPSARGASAISRMTPRDPTPSAATDRGMEERHR